MKDNEYFDKKHRPKTLSSFFGNETAKARVKSFKKSLPSTILLSGTTGCGKTTLARIIANKLKYEIIPFNVSHAGGIDLARHINETSKNASMIAKGKAYILNEMQGANKQCMNALLEVFEEPPKNTVFIICTTEPQHLLSAVKTRPVIIEVEPLSQDEAIELLRTISVKENIDISERTMIDIYNAADGIPRKMLIILNDISQIKDKSLVPKIIDGYGFIGEGSKQAIDFARAIYKKESFKVAMQKLREVKDPPYTIKMVVCNYASKILLNGKLDKQAVLILEIFYRADVTIGMPAIVHATTILYV